MNPLLNQMQVDATLLLLVLTLLMIFFISISDLLKKRRFFRISNPIIKTELLCSNCSLKMIREFRDGDYVFKKTDEKCKKCGGLLTISAIYDVSSRPRP